MSGRRYCLVSALVFTLVAVGHLWRAAAGWPLIIDAWPAPLAVSWLAVAVAGSLAAWGFRQAAR
jgi:hypothetical protein